MENSSSNNSGGVFPSISRAHQNAGSLPVAVEAMGGDHGPDVVVDGAVAAAEQFNLSSIIVGDEKLISARLKALGAEGDVRLEVLHAPQYVAVDESPAKAIHAKPECSILKAFELVKCGKAAAVISPGNSGAMMAAGLHVLGALPGVVRPAIASFLPRFAGTEAKGRCATQGAELNPVMLLDSGANVDCRAEHLVCFAMMGELYMRVAGLSAHPRVALLSNGSEKQKGNKVTRAAAQRLASISDFNFVGYVEGHDVPRGFCDVVVCDGFSGNILLKTMEGSAELVLNLLRGCAMRSWRGRLGIWLGRRALRNVFDEALDPSAYGGAPLLGLNGLAVVCHGAAKDRAILNAIRTAGNLVSGGLVEQMAQQLKARADMRCVGVSE